jgi:hypothetical protein
MSGMRGIVRKVIEQDRQWLVSFLNHSVYFHVPMTPESQRLRDRILDSKARGREIFFTCDAGLNIVDIEDR